MKSDSKNSHQNDGETADGSLAGNVPTRPIIVRSILAAGLFAVALTLVTWIADGSSTAMRTATDLAMPVGLLWLLLFAVTFSLWKLNLRRVALASSSIFVLYTVLFNGLFAGAIVRSVEHPPTANPLFPNNKELPSSKDDAERFAAVVSLGGYAGVNRFGVDELGGDGQRFLVIAQLWHAGLVNRIICTGDSPLSDDPSAIARRMLVSVGVPGDAIIELGGENTTGEMKSLKEFFRTAPDNWSEPIDGGIAGGANDSTEIALVTSAFHMPRAMRLAKAEGLDFHPLPCSFSGRPSGEFSPRDLVPNAGAAKAAAVALKEILAKMLGR